jgi:hypothetical protein
MPLTVEQNMDPAVVTTAATAGTTVPSTPDDSGASSVDLALQDLQVDDAAAGSSGSNSGMAQGRQGLKRDMDEAVSSFKRRKEFHPQVSFHTLGIVDAVQKGIKTTLSSLFIFTII